MDKYLFFGCLLLFEITAIITIGNRNFTIVQLNPTEKIDNGPLPTTGEFVVSPGIPGTPTEVNVSGRVAYVTQSRLNSIAFMSLMNKVIWGLNGRGAIGIIAALGILERVPGLASYGSLGLDFKIPCGVVYKSTIDYARTVAKNKTIPFIFYGYDHNEWGDIESGYGYVLFTLFLALCYLFNTCLAGYRFFCWIREKFEFSIGLLCIFLEFICNLLRVIAICLYGMHNNFLIPHVEILFTFPWSIADITTILITFFWLDLTADPLYHGRFMGIMKIPAAILIVALVAFEVAVDVLRTRGNDMIHIIATYFYASILAFVALVNLLAAYKIIKPFSKGRETQKKIKKIVLRIVGSCLASIMGLVVYASFSAPEATLYPRNKISLWFFLYFFHFLQSLLLILIFKVPKEKHTIPTKDTKDSKGTKE